MVEVDPETGRVEIEHYVAVDDCGNVINPMIVDGQVHGGVAQGDRPGAVRGDRLRRGRPAADRPLVDYLIPTAAELPSIELDRTVTPTPVNPLGAKGVGEAGTIAAPPAVVNAVVDALAHLGVDHVDMPLQPERVWQAIRTRKGGGRDPAPFDYAGPRRLEEAIALLVGRRRREAARRRSEPDAADEAAARPPAVLVDIGRVEGLRYVREDGDADRDRRADAHPTSSRSPHAAMLPGRCAEAAAEIGDPQVRNRGTIGGSLAHADPHADLPAALVAVGGSVTVRAGSG